MKHHHNSEIVETFPLVTDANKVFAATNLPSVLPAADLSGAPHKNIPVGQLYRFLLTRKPRGIWCNAGVIFCRLISLEHFFTYFHLFFDLSHLYNILQNILYGVLLNAFFLAYPRGPGTMV